MKDDYNKDYFNEIKTYYSEKRKITTTEDNGNICDMNETIKNLNIGILQLSQKLNTSFYYPIKSHRRILGPIVTFIKRLIRKATFWMLEPYAQGINDFQNRNCELLGQMITAIDTLKVNNQYLLDLNNEKTEYINKIKINLMDNQNILQALRAELEQANKEQESINEEIEQLKAELKAQKYISDRYHNNDIENKIEIKTAINKLKNKVGIADLNVNGTNEGYVSYSQCGEDGILNFILFSIYKKDPKKLTYLDIGCNHYCNDSNTYYLYSMGASGVIIEANPIWIEELRENRPRDIVLNKGISTKSGEIVDFYVLNNHGLCSFSKESVDQAMKKNSEITIDDIIKVETIGINDVLEQYFADKSIDVFSIDVEGIDFEILEAFNFQKYKPNIIIVEVIDYAPWVMLEEKRENIIELVKSKGYKEFAFTGINSIFINPEMLI